MPARVFEIRPKDRPLLEAALADDTLSRQSIVIRESKSVGVDRDTLAVLVEGSDAGILRAEGLILDFGRRMPEQDAVIAHIKAEESDAADGVGFIFGDV
ncbi:MAG TPA: hypothetical protein VM889_11135 [Candidatus Thermoplasmatota archaeon]|nr:hypothetical protein [Candidatus Thermoplasmatota archaeon]